MTNIPRTELRQKSGNQFKTVAIADVTHFAADCKYVTAYYPGGQLLLDDTLIELEAEFSDLFVRIHRSTLVARSKIRAVKSFKFGESRRFIAAEVEGVAEPLRIARRLKSTVRDAMLNAGAAQ